MGEGSMWDQVTQFDGLQPPLASLLDLKVVSLLATED